jgi:hypothetical protein
MFNWIRSLFKPLAKAGDSIQPAEPFVWCLVGNIVAEHTYGEQKQVKQGSKHFTPNTKVYCMPAKWGDA